MSKELSYDMVDQTEVLNGTPNDIAGLSVKSLPTDGMGCHAGSDQMEAAARAAGKSDILDQ